MDLMDHHDVKLLWIHSHNGGPLCLDLMNTTMQRLDHKGL